MNGYTETTDQRDDRQERMRLAGVLGIDWYGRTIEQMMECTCTERDEIACPACRLQAQERYPEIPYGGK